MGINTFIETGLGIFLETAHPGKKKKNGEMHSFHDLEHPGNFRWIVFLRKALRIIVQIIRMYEINATKKDKLMQIFNFARLRQKPGSFDTFLL